jgi:single-stranded-DNA-specific exonuclease
MKLRQGSKYLWKIPSYDSASLLSLATAYNLSLPIIQTLASRGFVTTQALNSYLFSSFEKDVMHPSKLKDAVKAVDRILYAIGHKEKILIFGDYDVDGITSSALMMHCLLPLGAQVNFYLPHRVHDGYGLSDKIVIRAAQNNYKVIITVDNGITAFGPAARAHQLGIDLIITDHHQPHDHLPQAFAIINPHQRDCQYPYKTFAGVGVTFKVLSLLYECKGLELPSKAYELLLLGTVADVVPLTGENRFWVRYCLNHVNEQESFSLRVLKQNGNVVDKRLSSLDIGFSITPQINALGRLEDPRQGVSFLIGTDEQNVEQVGKILLELNQVRKEIERSIFMQIVQDIEAKRINLEHENIILAASAHWTPGVIGLVASRLVGAYGKPALLFHLTEDGKAKGSCRSIPEFNIFMALHKNNYLLEKFGGHAMAAGLSLEYKRMPELKKALEMLVKEQLTDVDLKQKLEIDAELTLPEVTKKLMDDLSYLEPFGNENPPPIFYVRDVVLVQKPQLLKGLHVKCRVFADGVVKPVIFFNRPELFEQLEAQEAEPFDLAVQVTENNWQGRVNIELTGLDMAIEKGYP